MPRGKPEGRHMAPPKGRHMAPPKGLDSLDTMEKIFMVCYALNLQNDTQIQNMRRKDTQNTE